ncbi:MAG: hypothetical protein IJ626_00970 [Muribaculaceae bacterium]|nr:hypothetical protein [Muribaculaceae bacterium]
MSGQCTSSSSVRRQQCKSSCGGRSRTTGTIVPVSLA